MKIQKSILRETRRIALGVAAGAVLMCLVFLIVGKCTAAVLFGALYSSFFAVLNFFLMGITVQKALEREHGQARFVQSSYTLRMLLCVIAIIVGIRVLHFNLIATIVPFLLPKLVIYAMRLMGLYQPQEQQKEVDET